MKVEKLVFLLLSVAFTVIKPIISASSRAHAEIDRIYDKMADAQSVDQVIEVEENTAPAVNEVVSSASHFAKLDNIILIQIISFIEEPFPFLLTCKWFWNVFSGLSNHRVFNRCLNVPEQFNISAGAGGGEGPAATATSVIALTRAFGNRDKVIDPEFLAKNLELALYSPAMRAAFDFNLWQHVRSTLIFKELTESIFMNSYDKNSHESSSSPEIESHRRTLLYILASLPKISEIIEIFFLEYPINLLYPSTENCFQKLFTSISERVALIPINEKILSFFSFDERLIRDLIKIFLKTANHSSLKKLLETTLPEEFKVAGKSYIGCVPIDEFVYFAEKYLNRLDSEIIEIISLIEKRRPEHFSPFLAGILERFDPLPSKPSDIFHVAVLKGFWGILNEFQNFDFTYEKEDSNFLTFLIQNDPNYIDYLLSRFPKLATHRAFLLTSKYQNIHFATLTNLRETRIDLKKTIHHPKITRAHIIYIQDHQLRLFNLLLADSAERISSYFTLNLKGFERKRYKEHPSFNIALTTLDVYYETHLQKKLEIPELDPEIILRHMFLELNLLRDSPEEYLELARGLPSFAKALLSGGHEQEDTLEIPEAALTQDIDEFELLSRTIALNRVIHDGTFINYRLVLTWFEHFGTNLAGRTIPIHELKALLKGAAFQTIRTNEDRKLRFELDNQNRDEPFSMTYRYALIILVTQCKGIQASVIKRVKNLFPGANLDESPDFTNLLKAGCKFYHQHLPFFSQFKFVATNSRSERFLIDFLRHFIRINGFQHGEIDLIVSEFFAFINLDPASETLLRDHFIYFTLLASFKVE